MYRLPYAVLLIDFALAHGALKRLLTHRYRWYVHKADPLQYRQWHTHERRQKVDTCMVLPKLDAIILTPTILVCTISIIY